MLIGLFSAPTFHGRFTDSAVRRVVCQRNHVDDTCVVITPIAAPKDYIYDCSLQ